MDGRLALQTYSTIVESIYAAAFDPEQWSVTAGRVKDATNSLLAAFFTHSLPQPDEPPVWWGSGVPDGYLDLYMRTARINPRMADEALSQPGNLLVQSRLQTEEEFVRTPFYREFVQPMGVRDAMVSVSLRSGPRVAAFAVNSAATRGLYTDEEIAFVQLLTPHFCRAMAIADILNLNVVRVGAIEAALDGLSASVFLLDAQGHVLHMNRAAERIIAHGTVLTVHNQKLKAADKNSHDTLAEALSDPGGPNPDRSPSVPLKAIAGDQKGMVATLLPLDYARADVAHLHSAARWALFAQEPQQAVPFPGEAFGRLYGLSPAELRVTMALAARLMPEEAAAMLGVSLATVRTHLQRIFAKTRTNRLPDLIRLMLAATPPVFSDR